MVNLFGINLIGSGGGTGTGGGSSKVQFIPVTELPAPSDAKDGAVYLLASGSENDENLFDEYIVVNDRWEKFGSGSASVNGNVVSSVNTEEVAASVEESIMAQYGTNITQLGHELSEIKESVGSGGGAKTWEITLTEDQTDDIVSKQRFPLSDAEGASEAFNNAKEGDFMKVSYHMYGMEVNVVYVISTCIHEAELAYVTTAVANSPLGYGSVMLGDIYNDGVNTFSLYTFE